MVMNIFNISDIISDNCKMLTAKVRFEIGDFLGTKSK